MAVLVYSLADLAAIMPQYTCSLFSDLASAYCIPNKRSSQSILIIEKNTARSVTTKYQGRDGKPKT